jgi:hypothetical protein
MVKVELKALLSKGRFIKVLEEILERNIFPKKAGQAEILSHLTGS